MPGEAEFPPYKTIDGLIYINATIVAATSFIVTGMTGMITIQAQNTTTSYNFILPLNPGSSGQVLTSSGGGPLSWTTISAGGGGTVTSVGLAAPSFLTVSGSPITTAGTITLSYSGTALPVLNGGTGTTTSTGTGSVVLSTNATLITPTLGNAVANSVTLALTLITAAAGTTVLTSASNSNIAITGSTTQTIQLPDATTLPAGITFEIGNRTTNSLVTVTNNGGTTVASVQFGGFLKMLLSDNTTPNGVWLPSYNLPSNFSTGTAGMVTNGSISAAASLSTAGSISGKSILLSGVATGTISILPQATAGTYNLNLPTTAGTAGQVLTSQAGGSNVMTWTTPASPGTGTVTSVAASVPAFLSISGSPITTSGTLAITLSGTALPVLNGGTGTTTSTGTGSVVLSASPTITGTLNTGTIVATFTAANTFSNTQTASNYTQFFFSPNLTAGNLTSIAIGHDFSTNNFIALNYLYTAASSTANSLVFNIPGVLTMAQFYGTGQVSIPTNIASTSQTTGTLIVGGGIGAGGAINAPSFSTNSGTDLLTYSTGTFTPTILGGTTAGTYTYSIQAGSYQKIGKTCFIALNVSWTVSTGGTGNFTLAGLPFTVVGTANINSIFHTITNGVTYPATTIDCQMYGNPSTTTGLFNCSASGITSALLQIPATGSGSMIISGTFITT